MFPASAAAHVLFSSGATIGAYLVGKHAHQRYPGALTSPLVVAPLVVGLLIAAARIDLRDYFRATSWLGMMLGPTMVSFAVPIYERRAIVARCWRAIVTGVFAGSSLAVATAWLLSSVLELPDALRLSMLARSISTPFALAVSREIGGVPELTALFVVLTGLMGASIGRLLLRWLPLRSSAARGALFGMGAHAVGVATASSIGVEEGAIAGLVMIFAGLTNVMLAPALLHFLQWAR